MDLNNKSESNLEKRVYGIQTIRVKPGMTSMQDTFEDVETKETLPLAITELKDTIDEIAKFNKEELSNQKEETDYYLKKILISI